MTPPAIGVPMPPPTPTPTPTLTQTSTIAGTRPNRDGPRLGTAPSSPTRRIQQRTKQIEYGYNTIGYQNYTRLRPRSLRHHCDPQTPDRNVDCSARSWLGQVSRWRRKLHRWDECTTSPPPPPRQSRGDFSGSNSAANHAECASVVSEPTSAVSNWSLTSGGCSSIDSAAVLASAEAWIGTKLDLDQDTSDDDETGARVPCLLVAAEAEDDFKRPNGAIAQAGSSEGYRGYGSSDIDSHGHGHAGIADEARCQRRGYCWSLFG